MQHCITPSLKFLNIRNNYFPSTHAVSHPALMGLDAGETREKPEGSGGTSFSVPVEKDSYWFQRVRAH